MSKKQVGVKAPVAAAEPSGPAPMFAIVGKAPEIPVGESRVPAANIDELRGKLQAHTQARQGEGLTEDEAFGDSVIVLGGKEFKIVHPTMFQRRDMFRALAAVKSKAAAVDAGECGEEGSVEQYEAAAELYEQQVKILATSMAVPDPDLGWRAATVDEVGYCLVESDLPWLMSLVLPNATPQGEMEKAGLDPK